MNIVYETHLKILDRYINWLWIYNIHISKLNIFGELNVIFKMCPQSTEIIKIKAAFCELFLDVIQKRFAIFKHKLVVKFYQVFHTQIVSFRSGEIINTHKNCNMAYITLYLFWISLVILQWTAEKLLKLINIKLLQTIDCTIIRKLVRIFLISVFDLTLHELYTYIYLKWD